MSQTDVRRVGILFSGGPAPAANAVISAAATSFLDSGREVVGLFHGYSNLVTYDAQNSPMVENDHYRMLAERDVIGMRNTRGILIGTARANPGKGITCPADLADDSKTQLLRNVYNGLLDLDIDALISIGGDDTLKTANLLLEWQKLLPADAKRVRIVHLPKTIDNDYKGIDFTFGFFTAVDVMANEVQNLRADAIATSSYFIVETMGRKAGWLSYGVAIAGEANLVIAVEDIKPYLDGDGRVSLKAVAAHIVQVIETREAQGKGYGIIVVAEGIAEHCQSDVVDGVDRDPHGHISLGKIDLGSRLVSLVKAHYKERNGKGKKVTRVQLGYESRCAPPHAFDVMLGSQLGIGAFRALVERGLDGHMVSVSGQLDLFYVPFGELVDPDTLVTEVRFIKEGSDFQLLARFLENRTEAKPDWDLGTRRE